MEFITEDINELADLLYQERKEEAYGRMDGLIRDLTQYVSQIDSREIQESILTVLQKAFQAMEEGDLTLLADILLYELLENIE